MEEAQERELLAAAFPARRVPLVDVHRKTRPGQGERRREDVLGPDPTTTAPGDSPSLPEGGSSSGRICAGRSLAGL